ncbi:MAG: hypothetical protein J0M18_15855 [Ignavibacteria bacterium]|nr:hypothetical protein [Ignavibacteria bacterium]
MKRYFFLILISICTNLPAQWTGSYYPDYGPNFWNTNPNQINYISPYLYVANNGAYLYKTSDMGASWDSIRPAFGSSHCKFIVQKDNSIIISEYNDLSKSSNN